MVWAVIGAYMPTIRQDQTTVILAIALPVAAVAASLFLYRLRGIHPFWYGCIEIVVGLVVLIFTFVPTTHYLAVDRQTFFEWGATKLIGVMAGIYIIVRGLDNLDRDLPPSWRPIWDRIFPKQKRDTH
jgi:hypothetical protein